MNERPASLKNAQARIGKQVVLPWSKAVEIAMKSISVRFWRSMITMSSIILAIAFLMSIWTSTAFVAALALGPQREIDGLRAKLGAVRAALEGRTGARPKPDLERAYAADLAAARVCAREAIAEKQNAIASATSDEAKKLTGDIQALEAELAPDKALQLLHDYLADRRREIEDRKGRLDAILQQERAGAAGDAQAPESPKEAPKADEPPPARAAASGLGTFLSYMTATDKWLAVLALLVCFVGIVNAMFMTVQERFREIGTMKCLGALDAFIVKIFLIESTALGFVGTVFGIFVGMALSVVRQWFVYGWATFTYFPIGSVAIAALLSAFVGLVLSAGAAILPARNAARMEPVEAMRIEE